MSIVDSVGRRHSQPLTLGTVDFYTVFGVQEPVLLFSPCHGGREGVSRLAVGGLYIEMKESGIGNPKVVILDRRGLGFD